MASKQFKLGARVKVTVKDGQLLGTVAFSGTTHFSDGKWVGVILDQDKGKNNGTVQGKSYFECEDNHGIFVRQTQLTIVEESSIRPPRPSGSLKNPAVVKRPSKPPTDSVKPSTDSTKVETKRRSSILEPQEPTAEKPSSKQDVEPDENSGEFSAIPFPATPKTQDVVDTKQNSGEIEILQNQVRDLTEKLDTLKIKRQDDREKYKDYGTLKMQVETIPEYKQKISDLKKELKDCKKEAKELADVLEQKEEEYSDVAETIEMATLDKEMAEEKAETFKIENEELKEKLEEVLLNYNTLKEEVETKGMDGTASEFNSKQLEVQNERMKEALVRCRDLINIEKQNNVLLTKEKETLQNELNSIRNERDKLQRDNKELDATIDELKESVDAALGSEKMIEMLTDKNLELEDKINELEETIQELEELADMNNEIQETSRETEIQLREDLEMSQSEIRNLLFKIDNLNSTIVDQRETMQKFRALVAQLQKDNEDLKAGTGTETTKDNSGASALTIQSPLTTIDFKTKHSEMQSFAKTIENDLRKLEVSQCNDHVQYLMAFMTESFLSSAGDHDCILVILLVSRVCSKIDKLVKYLRERHDIPNVFDDEEVWNTAKCELILFVCNLIVKLLAFQSLMHQFRYVLSQCSVETFTKLGSLYLEMANYEKSIDLFITCLRKDQLDETTKLENFEKMYNFFYQLKTVVLNKEPIESTVLISDLVNVVSSFGNMIGSSSTKLLSTFPMHCECDEFYIFVKKIEELSETYISSSRKIKRRIPQKESQPLVVDEAVQKNIITTMEIIRRFSQTYFETTFNAVQSTSLLTDAEKLSLDRIASIRDAAVLNAFENVTGGKLTFLRNKLEDISKLINSVCVSIEDGEFDFDGTVLDKAKSPVYLRAAEVRSELQEARSLSGKLEMKDQEIKEINAVIKNKEEEISNLNLKAAMLEKKMKSSSKEVDDKVKQVRKEMEEVKADLERRANLQSITISSLKKDIDELERDKRELKTRLTTVSKRTMLQGITKVTSQKSDASDKSASNRSSELQVVDSPLLKEEISKWKTFAFLAMQQSTTLQTEDMLAKISKWRPLIPPSKVTGLSNPTGFSSFDSVDSKSELGKLMKQSSLLESELSRLAVSPRVIDYTKSAKKSPEQQRFEQQAHRARVHRKLDQLSEKIGQFVINQTEYASIHTSTLDFPTVQFNKKLQEDISCVKAARIFIPDKTSKHIKSVILPHELVKIHNTMVC